MIVAPEAPYPPHGGGALRTASMFEYLARRFRLDCILFREPGLPDPREALPEGWVRRADVLELPAHSRSLAARVARNAWRALRGAPPLNDRFSGFEGHLETLLRGRAYRLAVVEHFWCAPYYEQLADVSRYVALDLHNVESELYRSATDDANVLARALFRRFHQACLAIERRWLPRFPLLLTASRDDAARLRARLPGLCVEAVPNTIPAVAKPESAPGRSIVFSGNLEYHPNAAAVRYFHSRVWPLLKRREPGLVWRIVGKNAGALPREVAAGDGVEVVGPAPDAISELARSQVAVVPVLSGSGTRVKILEAWAAGVAVVSTSKGAEGLPARPGEHLLLADSPGAFAADVLRLLDSEEERRRLAAAGRALYEREFTWEAAWSRLDRILARAGIAEQK